MSILFNKNDEYYTLKETVDLLLDNVPIPYIYTVWCPFDSAESEFVKVLKQRGYNVIHTHIKDGQDFLNYYPNFDYDIIISNPPFSIKKDIIARINWLPCKKFILLFGFQSLSCSGFCNELSYFDDLGLFIPVKRVKFKDINGNINTPSFQSCFIHNLGHTMFLKDKV